MMKNKRKYSHLEQDCEYEYEAEHEYNAASDLRLPVEGLPIHNDHPQLANTHEMKMVTIATKSPLIPKPGPEDT